MADIAFILAGIAFFVLSEFYARICEGL